jgi:hypothetical protein
MKNLLYILCLLGAHSLSAQTATGSWYGRADVDLAGMHNNYLTELVIKQKGNRVDGIFGYYFKNKYQSIFVHGRYDPKTRKVTILNIPVIYFNSNSTVNSIDCNTNFQAVLTFSKVKTSLKGYFYADEKYRYMCPDLRVSYTLDRGDNKHDSILEVAKTGEKIWKPQPDDYVVNATDSGKANQPAPIVPSVPEKETVIAGKEPATPPAASPVEPSRREGLPDSSKAATAAANVLPVEKPIPVAPPVNEEKEDSKKIAESFNKRKTTLTKVLEVESDSVRLSFYDNGIIDGDSISVFVNKQLVLKHQELAAKALVLYLLLDSTKDVNEISMFAENLGKYPPNTALMVITDGKNRYEIFMSSSLSQNATIRLKRRKEP